MCREDDGRMPFRTDLPQGFGLMPVDELAHAMRERDQEEQRRCFEALGDGGVKGGVKV